MNEDVLSILKAMQSDLSMMAQALYSIDKRFAERFPTHAESEEVGKQLAKLLKSYDGEVRNKNFE